MTKYHMSIWVSNPTDHAKGIATVDVKDLVGDGALSVTVSMHCNPVGCKTKQKTQIYLIGINMFFTI